MKFQMFTGTLTGRLGRDVEMRYTPEGTAVSKFSIPFGYGEKNAQGEWENKTNWWNVTLFGKPAEDANEKLAKGDLVAVSGTPICRTYTNKDGVEKYALEIQYAQVVKLSKSDAPPATNSVTDIESWLPVGVPEDSLPF